MSFRDIIRGVARKIARGEELSEEEREALSGYLRYDIWEDLTRYEINRLRGRDEGPEYLREFWGLKDLSVEEIDRIRDYIHKQILQNPPKGARIKDHFVNPALELAAFDVAGTEEEEGEFSFSCWAEISKEELKVGCQNNMEAILSIAPSQEPGAYNMTYSGTLPFNVYDISPIKDYEVEDGRIVIEVDVQKFGKEGVEDTVRILGRLLSDFCREYNIDWRGGGSLVAECIPSEDLGGLEDEEAAENLVAALSQELSHVKAVELPHEAIFGGELEGILEDVECHVIDALHIRHYYDPWADWPEGRDQLVVSFACEGKARLDTPEKELEFASFIANLPRKVSPGY